jgi:hypothetical protein
MKSKEQYLAITDRGAMVDEFIADHKADLAAISTFSDPNNYVNVIIVKVRSANRTWNEIAQSIPGLMHDGLIRVMKDVLSASEMPERMKRAASYL